MDEHIYKPTKRGRVIEVDPAIDEAFLDAVAEKTDGFSGRQLAKLVIAYQAAVFGSGTTKLTTGLAEAVLQYKLVHREEEAAKAACLIASICKCRHARAWILTSRASKQFCS